MQYFNNYGNEWKYFITNKNEKNEKYKFMNVKFYSIVMLPV